VLLHHLEAYLGYDALKQFFSAVLKPDAQNNNHNTDVGLDHDLSGEN
jgi:hypothetical protein